MQRKRRNFSKAELAEAAERRNGQQYKGYWYSNDIVPVPFGANNWIEQNQRIFAKRNPPSQETLNGWRFMDNEGKQEATNDYLQSLKERYGDDLQNEVSFLQPGYGAADPGQWNELMDWQDRVFSSTWAEQYDDVDRPAFWALRRNWQENRHTYSEGQRYKDSRKLLNFVTERNNRVFDTPAFKRGKLTETDLDILLSDSEEEQSF